MIVLLRVRAVGCDDTMRYTVEEFILDIVHQSLLLWFHAEAAPSLSLPLSVCPSSVPVCRSAPLCPLSALSLLCPAPLATGGRRARTDRPALRIKTRRFCRDSAVDGGAPAGRRRRRRRRRPRSILVRAVCRRATHRGRRRPAAAREQYMIVFVLGRGKLLYTIVNQCK